MLPSAFHLKLLTPEETLVDAQAVSVVVPGSEGEFTALPGHMALISPLRPGQIRVILGDGATRSYRISGGFVDVGPTHCTILAEGLLAA